MDLLQEIKSPCVTSLDGYPAQMFLTLINVLMARQCPIGAKEQYPEDYGSQLSQKEEFDFIIVGGGSSGSVVANRLSEISKWRVLVLEAGGYPSATSEIPGLLFSLQGTEEDWQYKTERSENSCKAYKDKRCKWPRGKVLGGSSTINAMIYNRGNNQDYDNWEKEGNPGWSYKDLEVNFNEIENLQINQNSQIYGHDGFQALSWYLSKEPISNNIGIGAAELGYKSFFEQDPTNPMGYYLALMSTDKGVRMNAAKAFLGTVKNRNNLKIATKSHVIKILIDNSTVTARGVEVKIDNKVLRIFAKKEVILSAGSLNTPQILMHSGIGPKSHLEKLKMGVLRDIPGVGQNLQDHVIVPLFFKIKENAFNQRPVGHLLDNLYSYFMYRGGPLATIHITNLIGFVNTRNDSRYPNVQLMHVAHYIGDKYLLPSAYASFGFKNETLQELMKINLESNLLTVLPILLNPKSRGSVQLKSNTESPSFNQGYFTDEEGEDMETMLQGIRYVQKLFKTAPLQQHNPEHVKLTLPTCDALQYDSDEYWQCYIEHFATTIYHQVGTAKMGPSSDNMAVVDERLRVHGVKKLRVIDGSIMPKIVSGNTNAPCLAIGHKGGQMIIEDWKGTGKHEEL